jgi:hypothetical protein
MKRRVPKGRHRLPEIVGALLALALIALVVIKTTGSDLSNTPVPGGGTTAGTAVTVGGPELPTGSTSTTGGRSRTTKAPTASSAAKPTVVSRPRSTTTSATSTSTTRQGTVAASGSASPPTSTVGPTTTTTQAPARQLCRAAPSDYRPAAHDRLAIYVLSNQPNTSVAITVGYKTGEVLYPPLDQPGQATDSSGGTVFGITVAEGSQDYPVVVQVTIGEVTDECETHFTPTS